jgi:type IV secretion system protein TrbL
LVATATGSAVRSAASLSGATAAALEIGRSQSQKIGGSIAGHALRAGLSTLRDEAEGRADEWITDAWDKGAEQVYRANWQALGDDDRSERAKPSERSGHSSKGPGGHLQEVGKIAARSLREGDRPGHSSGPKLRED